MVEMIEPLKGRVFDPCCGSGGMFVQSEKFVEAHGGHLWAEFADHGFFRLILPMEGKAENAS